MESAGTLSVAPYLGTIPAEIAPLLDPLVARISSFLGPLPSSQSPGRRSIALFDAGPGQLGGPRIAQLATLIALAGRADEAGARFGWGILQEPQAPLVAGAAAEALRRLVFARTAREATRPQIEEWRLRLEEGEGERDLWVVGAPRIGVPPELPGATHLQIWDALEPGARSNALACRRGDGSVEETLLELPEDGDCVRLLRAFASLARRQEEREAAPAALWEDPPRPVEPATVSQEHRAEGAHRPRAGGVPVSRFATVLHRLTGRTALASRLSRAVSRHHAAYVRKMRQLFESGDFDRALRHAIPLTAEAGPRRLPLRSFAPRVELQIRPERSRGWSAGELSPDLHGELRRLYREAFHRLEGQGRIEEAAFLLAEVLHAHEEAVAFLERHGRLRLAAEMAEARDLPAGLVVRQWFLAGDRPRGLRIAHRTGAFADAVTRLERSRRLPEAAELRRLWANGLAAAGDYAAAVDVLWSLPEERHLALEWIDLAIGQGGAPAGRMLARKVALAPEPFAGVREVAVALLESWRADGADARLAFADELRRGPRTPAATTLARAAIRAIARDSGRLGSRMEPAELRQLLAFAGDGPLRADALALSIRPRESWISRSGIWSVEVAGRDAGSMAAHDAAFLPNGLTAVALGEAGVRLLSRGGRVVAELDQPAHRLVVSDHGDRAIALARRGDVWRLARLDLAARRAESWCDARLDAFAADYDGALWFAAGPDGLLAVDTAAKDLAASWGVSRLPGTVLAVSRSTAHCSIAFAGEGHEVWTYELPALTLRRRDSVPPVAGHRRSLPLAVSPEGALAEVVAVGARKVALHVRAGASLDLALAEPGRPGEPVLLGDWAALPLYGPEGALVHLIHLPSSAVLAEVTLARAVRVSLRLSRQYLSLSDDRGRVVVLDLENGQVRRDFRL